ncbi:MAG: heparinase II/III family protein [Acidobacteria bacterium]|nr:heparinase II/III family protein [Acidobacteriota bacterium]
MRIRQVRFRLPSAWPAGASMLLFLQFMYLAAGVPGAQANAGDLNTKVASADRPRLFFGRKGVDRLRDRIQNSHASKWQKLKAAVDAALKDEPPEYRPPRVGGDSTRPGTLNDEMLWQRAYGYRLPGMALVALLDEDPKYFDLVRRWALKPGTYPLWGAGIYENTGLAAKHQLFGISLAYDWLYTRWSEVERASLRETLRDHGRILFEAAEGINDRGWWKEAWRQNHAWNGYQAMAVTAVALAGEEPAAGRWLAKALWGGRHIVAELPDEGAYEEGIPYWGYGMEALMRFIEAVRPYSSEDLYSHAYFLNTHLFRLYMAGSGMSEFANFGDGRTTDWHAIRTIMYRLASEYRNGLTQWLAEALPDRTDIDAACWELLWYDPEVAARIPEDQPLSHVFKRTGFAGARTSWNPDALTLHLRSGKADVSHSHLDVNNFLLNAGGQWLLRDYGYGKVGPGYFNKNTLYFSTGTWGHNCLVINGRHQRRSEDSAGTITDAVDTGGLLWWRSDATKCYEGAESVVRELVLLRPAAGTGKWGSVVVRDQARTNAPATYDFMLQPGGRVKLNKGGFMVEASGVRLTGRVLSPAQTRMSVVEGIGGNINVEDPLSLRISAPEAAREMEFLVVLIPLAPGEREPDINQLIEGVRIGQHDVILSPDGRTAPRLRDRRHLD